MIEGFDRVVLAVPVLTAAVRDCQALLGVQAQVMAPGRAWLGLSNTVLELVEDDAKAGRIRGLVLAQGGAGEQTRALGNDLGLELGLCDGSATDLFRHECPAAQCPDMSVDHLVLRTGDAQGCIDLFSGRLGIRLALDRTVPEWGGRMLFFRAGKLTLEVIESGAVGEAESFFWGLAYQCPDIAATAARLERSGVELSAIRPGRKPGTRVATIKSHHHGIPGLLIEPVT